VQWKTTYPEPNPAHTFSNVHRFPASRMLKPRVRLSWVASPITSSVGSFPSHQLYYNCYCCCIVFQQLSAAIFTAAIRGISLRQLYTGSASNKLRALDTAGQNNGSDVGKLEFEFSRLSCSLISCEENADCYFF